MQQSDTYNIIKIGKFLNYAIFSERIIIIIIDTAITLFYEYQIDLNQELKD